MKKGGLYLKKNSEITQFIAFATTYIIVHIIHKLTGFNYEFKEGLLNFKLLIDLALWCIVGFIVDMFLNKVSHK